ncbi:hypothetical protein [Streptomyces sp. NBC_01483]|uniref:hypothetical protein n=1 Tax=Streptomyces sp. NBC_01483 TaxID=2903883 RepID=UPI002E36D032|nr:hypothetical protein [Streptomyces sp. NBC_01483]
MTAQGEDLLATDEFTDRRRHCFFGDRATHMVRRVDLVNKRTACGHWVWDKASKSLPRGTEVTCRNCLSAVQGGER